MFIWVKGNVYAPIATLYANNITLNNAAAAYFQDVRWVMIGIDHEAEKIAIRPVKKKDIDRKLVPMEQLHKVSIGKGYARITNKQMMEEISNLLGEPLNGNKYNAMFHEQQGLLIVELTSRLEKG